MKVSSPPVWDMNVQRMIDFIERNLGGEIRLQKIADCLGYSPFHCTRQFQRVLGMSLRRYIGLRRLSLAAQALRHTQRGILEIALDCGFSSQEALTRAFFREWHCNPGAWRRAPQVIRLQTRRGALKALLNHKETTMNFDANHLIEITCQTLPAHRFVGLRIAGATDYLDFWNKAEAMGIDCHWVEGTLACISANAQIGGWYQEAGAKGYVYGVELPLNYQGPIPQGMENMVIPASEYAVFHHPPYDFATEDEAVWLALQQAVAQWDATVAGKIWDSSIPVWQRHDPEGMGQAWCKALRAG